MRFKRLTHLALVAVAILGTTTVQAEGGYGSIGYFNWEIDSAAAELADQGMRVAGGYDFTRYGDIDIGVEAHIATGGSANLRFQDEPAEATLNKVLGLFVRPSMSLMDGGITPYALVGFAQGKVEVLAETTTAEFTDEGFAWGGGVEIALLPNKLSATVDYVRYIDSSDITASAVTLGVQLSFSGQ